MAQMDTPATISKVEMQRRRNAAWRQDAANDEWEARTFAANAETINAQRTKRTNARELTEKSSIVLTSQEPSPFDEPEEAVFLAEHFPGWKSASAACLPPAS